MLPRLVLCVLLSLLMPTFGMEPLALLATQPVWQAAQPISVNVDYNGALRAVQCSVISCARVVVDVCLCSSSFRRHGRD